MSAFDIIVLVVIGGAAAFGFKNGFVQEVLALIAWAAGIMAVRFFHAPLTAYLVAPVGNASGAAVLALILLYGATFIIGKGIARAVGRRTRTSVLGPIDRVLGFGFGAIKGLIAATLGFLLLVLGYGMIAPTDAPPDWMRDSRTYPLLRASGEAVMAFVAEHGLLEGE